MPAWQWVLKKVAKTNGCRYRVWLGTLPLEPLPNGGSVELRMHLKQWDGEAREPHSWCINITKYAAKAPTIKRPKGSMDPYNPLQQLQISQRDWPVWVGTNAPEIRAALAEQLPVWMAAAPPIQAELPKQLGAA